MMGHYLGQLIVVVKSEFVCMRVRFSNVRVRLSVCSTVAVVLFVRNWNMFS